MTTPVAGPFQRPVIKAPNPLPSDIDWREVASVLDVKIVPSPLSADREVIDPSRVTEGHPDFLHGVSQEVDGLGEFADPRVIVALEWDGPTGGLLRVLDSVHHEFAAGRVRHLSLHSSVSGHVEGKPPADSLSGESAGGAR